MKIKSLLLGLVAVIGLASCSSTPTNRKTDIPIEIVKLKENKAFDTTLTLATEKETYVFDYKSPTNDYVTTVKKGSDENSLFIAGLICGFLLALFFAAVFFD